MVPPRTRHYRRCLIPGDVRLVLPSTPAMAYLLAPLRHARFPDAEDSMKFVRLPSMLFFACSLFAQTETVTVIRAGSLIDGQSNSARANQVIVIRGNKIESVGDAASAKIPAGANVIDLSRATVLPGMIDTHSHLFLQGEDPVKGGYDVQLLKHPLAFRAARATVSARRALEQGFTTLRDVETEGAGYGDVGIKMAIEQGYIPGPRLFVVTRGISTTGGYNLEGYAPEVTVPKGVQIIDGPVEARKAAREQLDHGADWLKVYMTHRSWVDEKGNFVSQPTLTLDEIKAITDEAHGWDTKFRATPTTGSDCIAHLTAVATPSSTDSNSTTPPFSRWSSKAPGTCLRFL